MVQSDPRREAEAIVCLQEAILIARRQRAHLLELHATLDLARLLKRRGKIGDARSVIEAARDGVSEGHDLSLMVETREFIKSCH